MAYQKAGRWTNLGAAALAWAGGGEAVPPARAPLPQATAADISASPEARLKKIIADIKSHLGHRTPGSKQANAAIGEIKDPETRQEFDKRLRITLPELIEKIEVSANSAAEKKLRQELKLFIDALGSSDFFVREAAQVALNDVSAYAQALFQEMLKPGIDLEIRKRIKDIQAQNKRLSSDQVKMLLDDFKKLGPVGAKGRSALPWLMEAFWKDIPVDSARPAIDTDGEFKKQLLATFAVIKATPELIGFLQDQRLGRYHDYVMENIGNIGPDAKEAIPIVEKFFGNNAQRNYVVGRALGKMRAEVKNIPVLLTETKDNSHWYTRWAAMLALRDLVPQLKAEDKKARIDLLSQFSNSLQNDGDYDVRTASAEGIQNIIAYKNKSLEEQKLLKEKAVPALVAGVKYWHIRAKIASATAAAQLGADAEPAVPALNAALSGIDSRSDTKEEKEEARQAYKNALTIIKDDVDKRKKAARTP